MKETSLEHLFVGVVGGPEDVVTPGILILKDERGIHHKTHFTSTHLPK
jgi:hypothetical protein